MAKISDLIPDSKNANIGTQRGRGLLEKSLRELGAGRSILLDKNGRIIAGNKTTEIAADIGLEDVIIVETDGSKIVAVKRTDLDLDDVSGKARELAIADNRTGEIDLEWDTEALQDLFDNSDIEIAGWWRYQELKDLGLEIEFDKQEVDPMQEWAGMPEFEQDAIKPFHEIIVRFLTEEDYHSFMELIEQNLTTKTIAVWYPKQDFDQTNREFMYIADD